MGCFDFSSLNEIMFSLSDAISLLKQAENNHIKLSQIDLLDFLSPIYAVALASFINQGIIEKDSLGRVLPELQTYLERCNFLWTIGLRKTRSPYMGQSQNLIEITPIYSKEQSQYLALGGVDEICAKLFVRVKNLQEKDIEGNNFLTNLLNTVFLSVTELLDNISLHSEADLSQGASMYMLQYYPSKKQTHLAIIDNWIGIIESLKNSPHFDPQKEDKDYLTLALQKNITNGKGRWNGLAMVSEIIEETDSKLEIFTNGVLFRKNWQTEEIKYTWVEFNGTIVNIIFNMANIEWEVKTRLQSFDHTPSEINDMEYYSRIFE